jgi:NADPH:quinone reductase-like Zn-dependent oxidoreductase
MKAAVNTVYGLPGQVLKVIDVEKPQPKVDELLIRVYASGVNRTDDGFLRAKPWVVRLFSGITKPKTTILGCEFAGEVVQTGDDVALFKKGDRVFGFDDVNWGGHGEYKVINESKSVAKIPKNITYETAGVSGEGAHYALSYINTLQKLGAKRVLVNGATGAIGSSAVQLLKQAGFYVVATSTTKNMKLVKSLGADVVIDWEKEDFTKLDEKLDAVFDSVGKSSFAACKPILDKNGVYISTELGNWAQNPFLGIISPLFKLFKAKRVLFPLPKNNKQLMEFLRDRLADGSFKPVIDRTYPLDQIAEAYKYIETGQKTGNVVIKLS